MKYLLENESRNSDDNGWSLDEYLECDSLEEAYERAADMIHQEEEWERYRKLKNPQSPFFTAPGYRPLRIFEISEEISCEKGNPEIDKALARCEARLKALEAEQKVRLEQEREQKKQERERKEKDKAREERALYEKLKAKYEGGASDEN